MNPDPAFHFQKIRARRSDFFFGPLKIFLEEQPH